MQKEVQDHCLFCLLWAQKCHHLESRIELRLHNKGCTPTSGFLAWPPNYKPSTKLRSKLNLGNPGHVPWRKRQLYGPGQPKSSIHSFQQDGTDLRGQTSRTNSQNGPFSKLWGKDQGNLTVSGEGRKQGSHQGGKESCLHGRSIIG